MRPYWALLLILAATSCTPKLADGSASGDSTANKTAADSAAAQDAAPATTLTLPVTAEEAIDGDLVMSIVTTGLVRSESETKLKAEVGGRITEIMARPGERVQKDAPIVRLDPYEFDLAVRRAEAQLAQAQAAYEADVTPDSIVTHKPPSPERKKIAEIRAGIPAAKLALETAKWDKERSTIRAPFDGIIDHFDVSQGERISAGQVVTTIVDAVNLRIQAAVLEHDIALVKPGGDAQISTAAAPNRIVRGKITSVLPIVDSTSRAGRAYVRVSASDVLRPGMYADVKLEAQRLTNRRLVPSPAIIQRDGRDLVFIVKDNRAQWTYVVSGRSNGVYTEILPDTSGQNVGQIPVNAGDLVIVQGHLTLTHDAPVRVVAKRETDVAKD